MVCNNVSTQFKMFQRPYMLSRACVQCHRVNVGLASLVCHGARLRDLCYKSPGKGKGCCKASWEALGRLFKAPGFRMPWVASLSQAFVRLIFWGSVWESKLRQLIKRPSLRLNIRVGKITKAGNLAPSKQVKVMWKSRCRDVIWLECRFSMFEPLTIPWVGKYYSNPQQGHGHPSVNRNYCRWN